MITFLLSILAEAAVGSGTTLTELYVIAGSSIGVFLAIMRGVEYFINKNDSKEDDSKDIYLRSLQSEACKYDHKQVSDGINRIEHNQEKNIEFMDQISTNLKDLAYAIKDLRNELKK